MSTTHSVSKGTMTETITIPHPDLLDIIKNNLPGTEGIAVMYSVLSSLGLRAARLAGMIANGLASDIRNDDASRDTITSYNDAMSYLDVQATAEAWFNSCGGTRLDMCSSLKELLRYKRTCDDYMVSLMGETKAPTTDWMSTLEMAGEPMAIDQWKLDFLWAEYTSSPDADPQMTRKEYDELNTRDLAGKRALWTKHIGSVLNIIRAADDGEESIEFFQLSPLTQLSLLNSYATPERLAKFRIGCMKRARSAFEFDASYRLHRAFVHACQLATTHHRYANLGDALVPAVEPKASTAKDIAATTKARADKGVHADLIDMAVDAEKRAAIANALAVKTEPEPKPKHIKKPAQAPA